jgi:hypothetical protein
VWLSTRARKIMISGSLVDTYRMSGLSRSVASMRVEIAQGRWIRSPARTATIGSLCFVWAGVFTWLAFHHHERVYQDSSSAGLTVFVLILAIPGLMLGVRELRSGLWIDSDAVVVRALFRTLRLSPNDVDGFKAEMRLAPSPLLHRKHGAPVIIGALAHGGFLKSSQQKCLDALDPVCEQLNALLRAAQTEQPSRTPDALALRQSDREANYRALQRILVASAVGMTVVCAVAAPLLHTAAAFGLLGSMALVEAIGTFVVLRLTKTDIQRSHSADS